MSTQKEYRERVERLATQLHALARDMRRDGQRTPKSEDAPGAKIHSNLRALMVERGIPTVMEMVRRSGLAKPTVYDLYNNETEGITWKTLDALCQVLECEPGDLIGYDVPE